MSISDTQFHIGVAFAAIVLVVGITSVSFCGGMALPAKPPRPSPPTGTSSQLLTRSSASAVVYLDFVGKDAAMAGLAAPTLAELSRKFVYREDDVRHVLAVGQPPIEAAGVQLRALRVEDGLALEIVNATRSDIAYRVVTAPVPPARCNAASVLPFNAMTISVNGHETRMECSWHDGIALAVTRVETLELSPLSAWYVQHVPPSVVGIEPRITRGHRPNEAAGRCASALPHTVRSGLERGEIRWRDLVDFYARHRCQTYHFPSTYRAFETDSARSIPVVSAAM